MAWCKEAINVVYVGGASEYRTIEAPVKRGMPANVAQAAVAEIEQATGRRVLWIASEMTAYDRNGQALTSKQCREMIKGQ